MMVVPKRDSSYANRRSGEDGGIPVTDEVIRPSGAGTGGVGGARERWLLRPETRCWCQRSIVDTTWEAIRNGEPAYCKRYPCQRAKERAT